MQFPVLSVIVHTPIVAAIIILLMPARQRTAVRLIALTAAVLTLLLSTWVFSQVRAMFGRSGRRTPVGAGRAR